MKKTILLALFIISLSLVLFSFAKASKNTAALSAAAAHAYRDSSESVKEVDSVQLMSTSLYEGLHLAERGLSQEALQLAMKGYEKLVDQGEVSNTQYLTIVDLSQSSRRKRFYILDMKNDELVWNTYVAHGKSSGLDQATRFSNRPNSEASSLGFYITKGTYTGKHGLSLRIAGQEEGFNDNAEARGIVVHGAPYVNEGRASSAYMGRSQGCPALPESEYANVINIIKNGSVLFIYYPANNYINQSRLINS